MGRVQQAPTARRPTMPLPPSSVRELDDDSIALLLEARVDQILDYHTARSLCDAPLEGLCAALYGPGRCGADADADADNRLWRYACEKMGVANVPVYRGGPPTWRATFQRLCEELRQLDRAIFEHMATIGRSLERYRSSLEDAAHSRSAVVWAAMQGRPLAAVYHLSRGGDANGRDGASRTALMHASAEGHLAVVEVLLAAGADVNARGEEGETALLWASRRGDSGIVRALIAAGAAVDARDTRRFETALVTASARGHTDVVRVLLAAGADANVRNRNGSTPLSMARKYRRGAIVEALLAAGATE